MRYGKITDTERVVEIPFVMNRIKGAVKYILDIGSTDAIYLNQLAGKCERLHLLDTRPIHNAPIRSITTTGDVSEMPYIWADRFDVVTCISVLDHIGLDAYGNTENASLIHKAVHEMHRVLLPGGELFVTVPVSGRNIFTTHPGGGQRVFDPYSLKLLFPKSLWEWKDVVYWKLIDDTYTVCSVEETRTAVYAGHRAEAVTGIQLEKKL
jgi:SAM-dependent methyltransferase